MTSRPAGPAAATARAGDDARENDADSLAHPQDRSADADQAARKWSGACRENCVCTIEKNAIPVPEIP
ncbi:MAG TPA: hypothetical protein VGD71_25920, partial [Kribbella sp.]